MRINVSTYQLINNKKVSPLLGKYITSTAFMMHALFHLEQMFIAK